jgi:signal transduction histidine kinase
MTRTLKNPWLVLAAPASTIAQCWTAVIHLRGILETGGPEPRITDPWWERWAGAYRSWTLQKFRDAIDTAEQLIRACRPTGKKPPFSVPPLRPDLAILSASDLLVRALADRFVGEGHHMHTEKERVDDLRRLRDEATRLETRLRTAEECPAILSVHFGKGVWRYHEPCFADAVEEFEQLLAAAEEWGDETACLEARLWLALTHDRVGRGEKALKILNLALPQHGSEPPGSRRHRRLFCQVLAHAGRLSRHFAGTEGTGVFEANAAMHLSGARGIADELGDASLQSMICDFEGDLLLARGRRQQALRSFQKAESFAQTEGGSVLALGHARYSQAKWLLAPLSPVHEALAGEEAKEFDRHVAAATQHFTAIHDQAGRGMALLLQAQGEMYGNPEQSLDLFKQAAKLLRKHGPRRHLALALFRMAELIIAHKRKSFCAGEDPRPYLREALAMVEYRLSMPDRQALFREGLRQLPVEEWIDVLLHFADTPEPYSADANRAAALRDGASYLAHDYGTLLRLAVERLAGPTDAQTVIDVVATVRDLISMLASQAGSLAGDSSIGVRVNLAVVDLAAVVREVARRFQSVCKTLVVIQSPEAIVSVQADAALLKRVLFNLLVNAQRGIAAREKPPDGGHRIEIAAALKSHGPGAAVELTISDTGAGIAEDVKQGLFKRGKSKFAGGSGLGLFFCKQAMQAMGGAIYLKHAGGQGLGATFALRLRRAGRR